MIAAAAILILAVTLVTLMARRRAFGARVLIIGSGPLALQLVTEFAASRHLWHHVADVADDSIEANPSLDPLAAAPFARLARIIDALRPDHIVVALADRRGRLPMRELLDATAGGVVVEDGVDCYERLTGKIAIEALTPSGVIASPAFRKSHFDLAVSHVLSLVIAAVALVVLSPLFALLALLVKLDSPGPVFFVHDRVGLRGRRFRLLKFRTMRPADGLTSEWVRDNGHRITRVGGWLRRYRLDELPQLLNVLRGELNLVGPRPHPVTNFELFTQKIPFYSLRCVVRPGLTGWAQVRQGYANSLDEETEKMRHDLYYIKHMSAWLDLRILLRTVGIVLSGHESPNPLAEPGLDARLPQSLASSARRGTSGPAGRAVSLKTSPL
jgi:exopolysaccharide biosynthesis polyprenyl glycosylphosphotransferase